MGSMIRYEQPGLDDLLLRLDFEGLDETRAMASALLELPFPEPDASVIRSRIEKQIGNACEWCDIINTFFHRLSGIPDRN